MDAAAGTPRSGGGSGTAAPAAWAVVAVAAGPGENPGRLGCCPGLRFGVRPSRYAARGRSVGPHGPGPPPPDPEPTTWSRPAPRSTTSGCPAGTTAGKSTVRPPAAVGVAPGPVP